jgi:type III secretion system YscQ/HrcQ family protein
MAEGTATAMVLYQFRGLTCYSRGAVEALNCYSRLSAALPDWKTWLAESFTILLETYDRTVLHIHQKNEIEKGETQTFTFDKDKVTIGRSLETDVVLGIRSIGNHHTRIFRRDGRYYLEDLGSAVGTFLNDKRLVPHEPLPLDTGNRILIFPYSFEVELEEIWQAGGPLEITAGKTQPAKLDEYLASLPLNVASYEIEVEPAAGKAVLSVDKAFLLEVISRTMHLEADELTAGDLGIVEFLLVSVLQHANRSLNFPFQLSLRHLIATPSVPQDGCLLRFVLRLSGLSGAFRLFVPADLLFRLEQFQAAHQHEAAFQAVTWKVLVNAGSAHLRAQELSELEVGDIIRIHPQIEVVLPASDRKSPDQGWTARQVSDQPLRLEITSTFRRNRIMNQETTHENRAEELSAPETSETPVLDNLPIRLQVVLDQVELNLADLRSLAVGSILELDRTHTDSVQLAANGTLIGRGQLVDIEGRMGVRLTEWSKA